MEEIALEVLNKIFDYGYEAYIVGGFVRDKLLGIESNDVDITTNATPMELKNIIMVQYHYFIKIIDLKLLLIEKI